MTIHNSGTTHKAIGSKAPLRRTGAVAPEMDIHPPASEYEKEPVRIVAGDFLFVEDY